MASGDGPRLLVRSSSGNIVQVVYHGKTSQMPQPGQKVSASGKFMDGNGSRRVLLASDLDVTRKTQVSRSRVHMETLPLPDAAEMTVEMDMAPMGMIGAPPPMMMGPGLPGIGPGMIGPGGPMMMGPRGRHF